MILNTTQSGTPMYRGFSLVEVLIYASIVVLAAGAAVTALLSLNTVIMRNAVERDLSQAASASLERMVREVRAAAAIVPVESTFADDNGALSVAYGATTTQFYRDGDTVMMAVNGVEIGPLTTDAVSVSALRFDHYVGTETELIRASLTLTANSKYASSTRTYYTSAVLRGTYE